MPFNDGSFKPRTFANIRQEKETNNIHFEINQGKDKDGNELPPQIKRNYTGRLKEVKIKNWTYKDKPKESIQFIFDEGESETWIECGWSNVSKGILNTIDGSDAIGQVSISLYKNKKGYASAYVEVNGQKVGWKYQQEQLPAAEKKMVRGEEVFDDYDQIQFYKNEIIPEINSKIQNEFLVESEMNNPGKGFETTTHTEAPAYGTQSRVGETDAMDETDLPFHSPYNQRITPLISRRANSNNFGRGKYHQ